MESPATGGLAAASISAFSVILLFALYLLRDYDNNALISWHWVFASYDARFIFITLALGAVVAYMSIALGLPGTRSLFIIAVVLGAFFLPVPEVIIDSSRYFTQAKHLGQYGVRHFAEQWGSGIVAWTDLPLMPFIYGMGFRVFGESRIVVQAIVLMMFAGSVALTSLLGRDLFGDRAGRLAGMFLLSMPYLYTQVPLMMVDVPSMFSLVLAVYAFRKGLLTGGAWAFIWAPLAISMALFTKYSLWPMLTVTAPVLFLAYMQDKGALRRCLVISMITLALTTPLLWYYRGVIGSQIDLLVSYQRPGLDKWSESYFSTFFFHVHPFVTIAAIASLPIAIRRRELWLIPVVWLIALIVLVLDVKRIRYTIPVFPMLSIMAAYAVARMRNEKALTSYAYASLIVSFVLAFAAYAPFLHNNSLVNLKAAGEFLDESGYESIKVITLPQKSAINPAVAVPILDLYTEAGIVYEPSSSPTISKEELQRSSYRFTWTYRNPDYYKASESESRADAYLFVIQELDHFHESQFKNMEFLEKFDIYEGLFRFKTLIVISKPYKST